MIAAQMGHSETVQLLLQNGAKLEEKKNVSRCTCVHVYPVIVN